MCKAMIINNSKLKDYNLIASLAVFREVLDSQNDIYGLISTFIIDIIKINNLRTFSLEKLTNLLNENYGFQIPSPIIKTAINRVDFVIKKEGSYIVEKDITSIFSNIQDKKSIILNSNKVIIEIINYYFVTI